MTPRMPRRLSIRDVDLSRRRLFLRADFNVPLKDGRIADDARLRATVPTIALALERGASVVLASHLGRPKDAPDPRYSLAPVAKALGALLGREVPLTPDCTSETTAAACRKLAPGDVLLLENLRFHPEEKKGDDGFARRLATYADEYCNDAFGTCHRADASVAALPAQFRAPCAGLLVEREIDALGQLVDRPERPYLALLGGAKVSDKLPVLRGLLPHVDALLVGGAMAYTFLAATGSSVGSSLHEPELFDEARGILRDAEARGVRVLLPEDHVVASGIDEAAATNARVVAERSIPDGVNGVDIGPRTRETFGSAIADAKSVLWNGPLGVFEVPAFREGTAAAARAVASSRAFSVVGGGDSIAALAAVGMSDRVSHVSTGGGAMLELLAGEDLPGLAALAPAAPFAPDSAGSSR